jgi:hypothetical protein
VVIALHSADKNFPSRLGCGRDMDGAYIGDYVWVQIHLTLELI